jgi:hypothetical protein
MGPLDLLFGQIQKAITNHGSPDTPGPVYDANPLLGQLSGIFGQTAQQHGLPFDSSQFGFGGNDQNYNQQGGIAPSSQDPFGDPGAGGLSNAGYNSGGGGIASSNQDPFGDPGAGGQQSAMGEITSSNQDPFGDPGRG